MIETRSLAHFRRRYRVIVTTISGALASR
jgi:hypothetical protein